MGYLCSQVRTLLLIYLQMKDREAASRESKLRGEEVRKTFLMQSLPVILSDIVYSSASVLLEFDLLYIILIFSREGEETSNPF